MRTAALHNLGCKVNAYETEAMRQILEDGGYTIVPFTERADVYVINTCSVTNIADRKSRQMIHRARKRNPEAVIVATGCYVQAQANVQSGKSGTGMPETEDAGADYRMTGNKRDKACNRVPESEYLGADIIIGNNRKHELLAILDDYYQMVSGDDAEGEWEKGLACVKNINDRSEPYEELTVAAPAEHTRAFVKVQDGCNQFCSYCIIPYVRGRVRSRSMESVLDEVKSLAAKGYREVVLTGIHLSSYGVDLRAGAQGSARLQDMEKSSLLGLIRAVCAQEGIERVRLGSLEPKIVTEEFARELAAMPKVCPHFHLSLQSGCDETLRRMNRRYTTAEYEEGCRLLRKYFDDPAITTDVIVGFPGETEEEFSATKEFLKNIHFYEMHVFKYSRRKGTRADLMPDQVPEQVKSVRSEELIALGEQMSQEFRQRHIGTRRDVLLEEPIEIAGEKYFVGYTPEYIKVAVPMDTGAVTDELSEADKSGGKPQAPVRERRMQAGYIVSGRITERLCEEIYLLMS